MYITTCAELDFISGRRKRLTQYQKPIAYESAGVLRAISSAVVDSGIGERPHAVEQADFLTYLSSGGARRICPTRDPRVYIEIGAPAFYQGGTLTPASLSSAARQDNEVKWTAENYALSVVHGGHFLKTQLEFLKGYTPEKGVVAFPVSLAGVELKGRSLLLDKTPVMRLWPSSVYDLGRPQDAPLMGHDELIEIDGQLYIVTTLPEGWAKLKRPTLDPTLELQPAAAAGYDTYVYRGAADTSYATDYRMSVIASGTSQRVSLMLWDVSSIPAGSTIDSATLYLTMNYKDSGAQTFYARSILAANDGWVEAATWNYADGSSDRWAGDAGSDGGADAGCSQSGTDFSTSGGSVAFLSDDAQYQERSGAIATAVVSAWVEGANYGLAGLSIGGQINVYSSDESTAGRRPKLVVEYTEAGGDQTLYPTGIAGTLAIGSPTINKQVAATGIASAGAMGTATVVKVISATGIASGVALGTPGVAKTALATGIASGVSVGTPTINKTVSATGIAGTIAMGVATVAHVIGASGIASTLTMGVASLYKTAFPAGIASTLRMGTATILGQITRTRSRMFPGRRWRRF